MLYTTQSHINSMIPKEPIIDNRNNLLYGLLLNTLQTFNQCNIHIEIKMLKIKDSMKSIFIQCKILCPFPTYSLDIRIPQREPI